MNTNILEFISCVLIGDGIQQADIPTECSQKSTRKVSETNISDFISLTMSLQKTGNILVITNSESISELVKALNKNLPNNMISVICNGVIDTSALEKEIESKSLHTKDGRMFIPEEITNYPDLMHSGSQIIIKKKPYENEEVVFNKNNEIIGVLLDNSYKYENIIGNVSENMELLTNVEKAKLMLEIINKNNISDTVSFSDIVIIKKENEQHCFIVLPSSENVQSVYNAELQLFIGLTTKNTFCEIVKRISELTLPDFVIEDIEKIVTNFYISQNNPLPNYKLIKNTMERIILMEEFYYA